MKRGFVLMAIGVVAALAGAQQVPVPTLAALASVQIPWGTDADIYGPGGGVDLQALFHPGERPFLNVSGTVGYAYIPTETDGRSLSRLSAAVGAGVTLAFTDKLRAGLFSRAGWYYGFFHDGAGSGGNPMLAAGVSASYDVSLTTGLALELSYGSYLDLQNVWAASAGVVFRSKPEGRAAGRASLVSLKALPAAHLAAGPDADIYEPGGGIDLSLVALSESVPLLFFTGDIGYGFLPTDAGESLSRGSIGAGIGASVGLGPALALNLAGRGGYYAGVIHDGGGSGSGPYVGATAGLALELPGPWGVDLDGGYTRYFDLADVWSLRLGASYDLPGPAQSGADARPRPLSIGRTAGDDGSASLSLRVRPTIELPVAGDRDVYGFLGGLGVTAVVASPSLPFLYAGVDLGYGLITTEADLTVSRATIGGVTGVRLPLSTALTLDVRAGAGYYHGFINDGSGQGGDLYTLSGMGLSLDLAPAMSLTLDAAYGSYPDLLNSLAIGLGAEVQLLAGARSRRTMEADEIRPRTMERGRGVEIRGVQLESVFPVFYKYYDSKPVGRVTIHNWETTPAEKIKVGLFVKQYMDNPKITEADVAIGPGQSREVEIYGLFTDSLLGITEGSLVSALLSLEYVQRGKQRKVERIESLRIQGRNAMTWDDDRRAAAFVTAKDESVLRLAKSAAGVARSAGTRALDQRFLAAMAVHQALKLHGMRYVVDPATPYVELSKKKQEVDFLQFPRQSLEFKAGDCDDLSILYSALLEAVGIETAFITVPGHIFAAFALEQGPEQTRKSFSRVGDLIFEGDKVWVPVEITEIDGGFLAAWQAGAKQWAESRSKGEAALHPIHEAWKTYEPTGLPGDSALALPEEARIAAEFRAELVRFVDREISPQVARLQAEIRSSNTPNAAVNKLGVLYARYGLEERAQAEFERVVRATEFVPALLNLGNLYFLKGDMRQALAYYERAQRRDPANPHVILAVARVNHELENYGSAREAYGRLRQVAPEVAEQFAYLDLRGEQAARAAEANQVKGVVLWEE